MKLQHTLILTAALALGLGMALAIPGHAKERSVSEKGEIIDTACYFAHGARGEKHRACAQKCINEGAPMGLLTAKGKVFLLLPNHDNSDPYAKAKGMAADTVTVKGEEAVKGGISAIIVESVEKAQ